MGEQKPRGLDASPSTQVPRAQNAAALSGPTGPLPCPQPGLLVALNGPLLNCFSFSESFSKVMCTFQGLARDAPETRGSGYGSPTR